VTTKILCKSRMVESTLLIKCVHLPRKDLSDIFCCSEWNNSEKKPSNFHFVVSNLKPSKSCQWGMFLAKRKPKYNAFVCHETNRVQNSTVLIQRPFVKSCFDDYNGFSNFCCPPFISCSNFDSQFL